MTRIFRVEITATAEADVADIWAYIGQDEPDAATAFILHLEARIETLERFPARCPCIPENFQLGANYRHLIHGHYRAIFKIADDRVILMRVLHGARLLDTTMLDESAKPSE